MLFCILIWGVAYKLKEQSPYVTDKKFSKITMKVFNTKANLEEALAAARAEGKKIGLVPTMGARSEERR